MATVTLSPDKVERYVQTAHDAGCPREQVENFLRAGYFAFPTILPFHAAAREADRVDGPDEIALGGTRAFGKTHAVMAQVGLDDCQRVPGLKYLFLRKVMKSAAESMEDVVYKVFQHIPFEFTPSTGRLAFSNGSRILIGGFNNESDIDKYLGIEYDGLVIEEATQLSQAKRDAIYGSVRSVKPGWRVRKYLTTNPDGIGLSWFKPHFVETWRQGDEKWTRFYDCHWRDNPLISLEYVRYLENLTGPLAKAWRDGDWDAFEGMAFPNWDISRHVVEPFTIPEHWAKWRAYDWGYSSPACCLWLAKNPDNGRVIVYREHYPTYQTDRQQASTIRSMTPPTEQVTFTLADPSVFSRKNHNNIVYSTADEFAAEGVILTPADNDRLQGKRKVDRFLGDLPDGAPQLQIFRTCLNLVRTLPMLPFDPVHTEDVDTKAEDHAYDALRYGLTNVESVQARTPMKHVDPMQNYNPLAGLRGL